MEQRNNIENPSKQAMTKSFLRIVAVVLCVFIGYVCGQCVSFRNSEKAICNKFERHLTEIDSIYNDHLRQTANVVADTSTMKSDIIKKLYADSIMLAHERNLAIESQRSVINLHIEKVDNDYTVITIWGAVLSILFIVFSFFSIYKIEDTKNQMEELRKNTDEDAKKQLAIIKEQIDAHKTYVSTLTGTINELIKKYDTGYSDFEKRWDDKLSQLNNRYQDAINMVTKINITLNSKTQKASE